jgi:hypothetical protein
VQLAKINQFTIDEEPNEELVLFIFLFAVVSVSGAAAIGPYPGLRIDQMNQTPERWINILIVDIMRF